MGEQGHGGLGFGVAARGLPLDDRRQADDRWMFVVEGLDLFGAADEKFFQDPLHPNDEGNERIAQRLAPIVAKALMDKPVAPLSK